MSPLHALGALAPPAPQITIVASDQDYVVLNEHPWIPTAGPIQLSVVVAASVILDASDSLTPALSFAGIHEDSVIGLTIQALAYIRGAGGAGARGGKQYLGPTLINLYGGGGGGAGSEVGLGGETYYDPTKYGLETNGLDGLTATGSNGGSTDLAVVLGTPNVTEHFDGVDGGTAILTPCKLVIANFGFIHAGGGGGAAGGLNIVTPYDGTSGGDVGEAGEAPVPVTPFSSPGAAGYAVNHGSAPAPEWTAGEASPNTEGLIG